MSKKPPTPTPGTPPIPPEGTPPTPDPFDPTGLSKPAPASDPAPDPFDPASLRLTGDVAAGFGVKKHLLTVPVRKPDKAWFVRAHPDPAYWLETAVIELKEDRETYLVAPALWSALATETTFGPRALVTAINRQGVVFLWPVRMPGADGKIDEWSRTAMEAARLAKDGWVRVQANMNLVRTRSTRRPATSPSRAGRPRRSRTCSRRASATSTSPAPTTRC